MISIFCTRHPRTVPRKKGYRDFDRPSPAEISPVMPAVSVLRMDLRMAGPAQGEQVAPLLGAALRQRQLMVDLLGLHIPPFLQALLTQRMLQCVLIADPFPCPSVSAAYSRIPAVLLVASVLFFLVVLTKPWGIASSRLSLFIFRILTISQRHTVMYLILLYCFRNFDLRKGFPVKPEYIIDAVAKLNRDFFPSHIGQVPQF